MNGGDFGISNQIDLFVKSRISFNALYVCVCLCVICMARHAYTILNNYYLPGYTNCELLSFTDIKLAAIVFILAFLARGGKLVSITKMLSIVEAGRQARRLCVYACI